MYDIENLRVRSGSLTKFDHKIIYSQMIGCCEQCEWSDIVAADTT